MRLRFTLLLVSLVVTHFFFGSLCFAEVPGRLSYQGVLKDSQGAVVPDGTYTMTFRIYNVASGGSPLWEETQDVSVSKGVFNVVLGSVNPLDVSFSDQLYLGISVSGEDELTPRLPFTSVPYSFACEEVIGSHNIFPSIGNVGIGNVYPQEKLDVAGAIRIGYTSSTHAGTIRWTGTDFEGYDGTAWRSLTSAEGQSLPAGDSGATLRHDGTSWIPSYTLYNDGSHIGVGTMNPTAELHVGGTLRVGTATNDGVIEVYDSDIPTPLAEIGTGPHGAYFTTYDENGNESCFIGTRDWTSYGEIQVSRDSINTAFWVMGNFASTGHPSVAISGSERGVGFRLWDSGNSSVILPDNSIGMEEIYNEAGVTSQKLSIPVQLSETEYTILESATLVNPATTGFIIAIASGKVTISHNSGIACSAEIGLSTSSSSINAGNEVTINIPSSAGTGSYSYPFTLIRLFVAFEGDNTIYLIGKADPSTNHVYCDNVSLILLYIPTSYGSIYYAADGKEVKEDMVSRGLTLSDVERIRQESIEANNRRVEEELARVREELEQLKREMARYRR